MNENLKGCFARSLVGHDKCAVYVIINNDNEYVYLSDGKNRLVDRPKKKKRKHIQIINQKDSNIESKQKENIDILNEDIKRAIKIYISNK